MAEQCSALCDFEADSEEELSFSKGERITVLAKGGDAGFWEGVIEADPMSGKPERTGRFASCMVTSNMNPDRDPIFIDKAMALYDYVPNDDFEMPMTKGDILTVLKPHASSPGWWLGINESELARKGGGTMNVAPSYTPGSKSKRTASTPTAPSAQKSSGVNEKDAKIFPSNFVTSKLVMALFPFQGRHGHELSFQVKEVILLHRKWNDGWWEGSLKGKRGIFPSNYTAPNVTTTETPFFCQRCKTVFPPGSWECKECARNEEITKTMMQALDDFSNHVGSSAKSDGAVDIFAYVDVDPKHGRGALLTVTDTLDRNTIGPRNT